MKSNKSKLFVIIVFAAAVVFLAALKSSPVIVSASAVEDPAAAYKAKCAMCHGPTAAKAYDPAKPEEAQVETILKGRKGEKPPFMPGYEAKGMTADEAKALNTYMKSLRAGS